MFTGMVIDELMNMVERVEGHAQDARPTPELDAGPVLAHLACAAREAQPLAVGVA